MEQFAFVTMKPFWRGGRVQGLLVGEDGEVVGVDEGDEEGDGGVSSVVFCV